MERERGQQEPIWSVSEVNAAVRDLVEGSLLPFWVTGEVSSLVIHSSGHVYMSLKDQDCQLRACWFKAGRQCRELKVANGTKIEAYGRLTVYPARGEYQFTIRTLRIAGQGDLFRRFEELKKKLEAEGLFSPERKRPIPQLPRIIGVVTSPTGAAIRDFLKIIDRRFPQAHVRICPCQVQGTGAAAEIAAAVDFLSRTKSADVIVVTRGGGSMEDLWAFNEEPVARAVAASNIPVISAVGHEIDFTICDFAADLRVPTPSAAAELVISGFEELSKELRRLVGELHRAPGLYLATRRGELERLAASPLLQHPERMLEMPRQRLDEAEMRLTNSAKLYVATLRAKLDNLETALRADDPHRQLERGFALVRRADDNTLVRTKDVAPGTRLNIQVADGEIPAAALNAIDELF